MATVLTMPARPRKKAPGAVLPYRRRTRVVNGRVWEVVERVEGPRGGTPAPFGQQLPWPVRHEVRAVA